MIALGALLIAVGGFQSLAWHFGDRWFSWFNVPRNRRLVVQIVPGFFVLFGLALVIFGLFSL